MCCGLVPRHRHDIRLEVLKKTTKIPHLINWFPGRDSTAAPEYNLGALLLRVIGTAGLCKCYEYSVYYIDVSSAAGNAVMSCADHDTSLLLIKTDTGRVGTRDAAQMTSCFACSKHKTGGSFS
jgi:hypothetical protein